MKMILNPLDIQSKHIHTIDGITSTLYAGECRYGGGEMYVLEERNELSRSTEMDTVVRRLTPGECTILQGFPQGWVDIGDWYDSKGKLHKESDSAKYKALGNAVCVPFWRYLARRIAAQHERTITMGSLFAGIGGFELAFKQVGALPRWSAEIEEFPIAVLKKHFGDDETGEKGDVNTFL